MSALQRAMAQFLRTSWSLCMLLTILGCGKSKPPIAPVTGTVTFENKPLPDRAIIHFMSDEGFGSSCELQPDGTFKMGSEYGIGIPLGSYRVSIAPPVPTPRKDEKRPLFSDYYYIPRKYRDFATNDFSAVITADGSNEFHFNMTK
mgnify:CR=1 FL=1